MRAAIAGLIVAFIIVVIALFVAAVGALGVAAIGWLLSRWFDLTQWQGSLIALIVSLGIGFAVFRLTGESRTYSPVTWEEWDDEDDDEEDEPAAAPAEPPVVAWRRQRPTQGSLPAERQRKPESRQK